MLVAFWKWITKTVAFIRDFWAQNAPKCICGLGFVPGPLGSLQCSCASSSWIYGGRRREKGRLANRKERKGRAEETRRGKKGDGSIRILRVVILWFEHPLISNRLYQRAMMFVWTLWGKIIRTVLASKSSIYNCFVSHRQSIVKLGGCSSVCLFVCLSTQ